MDDRDVHGPRKGHNVFQAQASDVLGEEFWRDIAGLIPNTGPRIDIYYTASTVVVLTELPGLERLDQIKIMMEGQSLVIEGELPRLYPATDKQIVQQERFFGSFRRSLPMPKVVSAEGVQARYNQGLLIVELQIEHAAQTTTIPIDIVPGP